MHLCKRLLLSIALGTTLSASLGAAPLRTLPGLFGFRFFESSAGSTTSLAHAANGTALTTQIAGGPVSGFQDMGGIGLVDENYDMFYSNSDGTFNLDGEFITVLRRYSANDGSITEVYALGFDNGFLGQLVSYAFAPTGAVPSTIGNIGDGDTGTFADMGWSSGGPGSEMSRLTFSFPTLPGAGGGAGGAVPEPGTWGAMALGLTGLAFWSRRQNR